MCILYLQDSSDDYHGVVGRFRGHSEAADEELAEYFIEWVPRSPNKRYHLTWKHNLETKLILQHNY